MARRKDVSWIDVLARCPWWIGPILTVAAFCVLRFLLPAVLCPGPAKSVTQGMMQPIALLASYFAPFVAGAILVVWVAAEFKKRQLRRLLDKQTGLASIRNLSWAEFERLVGEAYRRQGYRVEETGSASGDGGVDLVLTRDGEQTLVQCKQWKAWKVGVKPVRELLGVVHDRKADRGVLITSGRFTAEAEDFADNNPIDLVDGKGLEELVATVKAAAVTEKPPAAVARPADAPAREPEPSDTPPLCPSCGVPMVKRVAGRGVHAGKAFWGCPTYPKCRGTRPA